MKSGATRTKKPAQRALQNKLVGPSISSFPIVGIGASAGGLEALEQFLKHVPAPSGMAFVIIQHLDPTRKGIMPELLQRCTRMKVVQVLDRTRVQPNCVYVIPPNKDMSILKGVLHLLVPTEPRGRHLSIDYFFRSLAQDQQERSIGIVLSGMGSDGTLGLQAIKEKAGVVLVQDPGTAKYDSMPHSVVAAGLADIVAPVEDLPEKLMAYLQKGPSLAAPDLGQQDKAQNALEKIVILLRSRTGHDFSMYKKNTLYRRIERRMGIHRIEKIGSYVRYLQQNDQELDILFKELLIGVTGFFRDPGAWEHLREQAVPSLLARRASGYVLRAWVPGCSTGEEAYSLAMVFREALEQQIKPHGEFSLQIYATDIDASAIERARQGFFPDSIAADVSPERLKRFFVREEKGYRVRKEIREMVIFASQDLLRDPPFTKLDILSCRNLLIYLSSAVQKKLFPLFHFSLKPGGILFLGSSESIADFTDLFASIHAKSRLFRRRELVMKQELIEFPRSFSSAPSGTEPPKPLAPKSAANLQTLADQWILQHYSPPTVLVNDKGDIVYVSGRTGKYLEPAAGKANWNILAMAREGLRYEIGAAFQKALRQDGAEVRKGLKVESHNAVQYVDVTVQKLKEAEPLRGLVLIVFSDVAEPCGSKVSGQAKRKSHPTAVVEDLKRELLQARLELHSHREEMQSAQEELMSTNEELQSTNEELQSTNEELTTSREEMQSLNEELQTVNAELQSKVDELSRSNNDMKNLLNSTDIATLFLDHELRIRRFTPEVTKIIKLISSDIGRLITDLASALHYPDLEQDVREVLRTLVFTEKPVTTRDNRWYTVRIMPYRTLDDRIDGVVITFLDITVAKSLETALRKKQTDLETRLESRDPEMAKREMQR